MVSEEISDRVFGYFDFPIETAEEARPGAPRPKRH
jgi:hypothetical protein